jgi:hypothetical protein
LLLRQPDSGEDDHVDHGAGRYFLLSHTVVRATWLQKKSHPTHLHHNMVTETFPEHILFELRSAASYLSSRGASSSRI